MNKKISHILLDLDGTLTNSMDIFYEVDRQFFAANKIELTEDDLAQMQLEDGFEVLRSILDTRSNLTEEEKVKIMHEILEASVNGLAEKVRWYPDVEPFVKDSLLHPVTIGIVTRSNARDLDTMQNQIPVRSLIPIIIQGEDTKGRHKPNPYPLILAAERLNVGPENCIYVGDHQNDLRAANAAGMKSCIILRKHVPQELIQKADFSINSLSELFSIALNENE